MLAALDPGLDRDRRYNAQTAIIEIEKQLEIRLPREEETLILFHHIISLSKMIDLTELQVYRILDYLVVKEGREQLEVLGEMFSLHVQTGTRFDDIRLEIKAKK